MTGSAEQAVAALVEALIAALERDGVRYAILRNHERYPLFGNDVDLLVHGDDLDAFRRAAAEAASKTAFDAVTECRHWAQSGNRAHDFLMFRFYRLRDLAYIKVDVFHGYTLQGLAFIDEEALLAAREREPQGRFAVVGPALAELWRMCQLANELGAGRIGERTERHRARVLACAASPRRRELEAALQRLLPVHGRAALAALEARDDFPFLGLMRRARQQFVQRRFSKAPLDTAAQLARRAVALLRTRLLSPCGFDLRVRVDDPAALEAALARLREADFLSHYAILRPGAPRPRLRRRLFVRHFSGMVVHVVDDAALDLRGLDEAAVMAVLALVVIDRHPRLEVRAR